MTAVSSNGMLECPLCGTPAVPPSLVDERGPAWCEDDEADCPGCGEHLRANITGDGESEWIEAIPTNEDLVDG